MRASEFITEGEGDPNGVPHVTKKLLQHIVQQVGTEGAHAIIKSLEWGDGASKELLHLIVDDLKDDIEQAVTEEINPDCFDPAFNDTQEFDGLTYRATVDQEYGKPVLTIRVLDDNFQQVGLAKFKQSKKGVVSLITSFRPEYQGQGLARNIYAYVRAMGNTIVPSRNQLPPGRAMWAAWKKSGDAKHLMKDVAEGYTGPLMKFLKAGELAGSYTIQQLQALGFKQSANGAWYIPMEVWQKLVGSGQIKENFADGRNPQDKGDSQRHGIPKGATMAELEKASHAAGRKGQLARWQLNMRRGHKK